MSGKTFAIDSQVKNDDNNSIPIASSPKGGYYGYACFVICGSCFWCVSDLSGGSRIKNCPVCKEQNKIESIPLAPRERYTFENDSKAGIILDFAPG
jgi:hypothetical protein